MAEIKKINTELQPIDKLLDTSGDAGTSGQILSSTGSGTNWIANTGGGGTVTGTGVANRIAFWSDTSVLSSDADFYVDGDTIFTDNLNISSNLSIGGDIYKTSGNLTLDVAGDIKLSADGGDWYFQDGAANILVLTAGSNSSPTFAASQQDADIIFTGNDGGTTITALTLDMSDVGSAHFNNGLFIPNYIYHTGDTHTYFGFTGNDAFAMVFEGTTRLSVADSADPVFTMNAHLNMSTKDIDYVSQLHFADNVRWKDNGNDSDLNFVYGDTSVGHLRFVNGSAVYKGGIYAESGYFGTFSPDGSWAVQSSNSQTNITHKLEVQGNADLKADNVNLDWMHADADQVLRIEIDSGNDAYFSVTGNNDFYFRTNSTTALKIDGSQNSTFYGTGYFEGRVTIIPGYSGYDQIKIASNTTANTNKLSGIYTENYEGNNVSIFQTFTQDNNNTIYYGSADNNYAGMQNHRFYVNADSDTAGSGHTQALHIASDTNATFAGTLTVEGADAITIPDYILHAGDDSKFGFPSNDNFKIRLAGNDLFTMNTTTATFAGDLRISGSDLYLGTGSTSVNIKGYNDKTLIQGVSGATYMYGGNQTTLALTLQAGYAIAGSGFAYGAVNAYTKIKKFF